MKKIFFCGFMLFAMSGVEAQSVQQFYFPEYDYSCNSVLTSPDSKGQVICTADNGYFRLYLDKDKGVLVISRLCKERYVPLATFHKGDQNFAYAKDAPCDGGYFIAGCRFTMLTDFHENKHGEVRYSRVLHVVVTEDEPWHNYIVEVFSDEDIIMTYLWD